jgi:hypothetical protein
MKGLKPILLSLVIATTSNADPFDPYPDLQSTFRLEKSMDLLIVLKMCMPAWEAYEPDIPIVMDMGFAVEGLIELAKRSEANDDLSDFMERMPKVVSDVNKLYQAMNTDPEGTIEAALLFRKKCSDLPWVKKIYDSRPDLK